MNKYYLLLGKVLAEGKTQQNKKGKIKYLLNEQLMLTPADLLDIFESHGIARKKLKEELKLFMQGERNVERYREAGIAWWDYCGQTLVNSYPTYMEKLPPLIERINKEKRNSKNYVLKTIKAARFGLLFCCFKVSCARIFLHVSFFPIFARFVFQIEHISFCRI